MSSNKNHQKRSYLAAVCGDKRSVAQDNRGMEGEGFIPATSKKTKKSKAKARSKLPVPVVNAVPDPYPFLYSGEDNEITLGSNMPASLVQPTRARKTTTSASRITQMVHAMAKSSGSKRFKPSRNVPSPPSGTAGTVHYTASQDVSVDGKPDTRPTSGLKKPPSCSLLQLTTKDSGNDVDSDCESDHSRDESVTVFTVKPSPVASLPHVDYPSSGDESDHSVQVPGRHDYLYPYRY
jgi:hypothetical protein